MALATCAECDEEIEVSDRARLGQRVVCSNCGAQLEVVSTNPLELDPGYDDDDGWDDDDDLDGLDDDEVDADWDADEQDEFDVDLDDDEKW
jgi:alpha-aminoadipate carrier protein LysW